jgi:hypothetical protein
MQAAETIPVTAIASCARRSGSSRLAEVDAK